MIFGFSQQIGRLAMAGFALLAGGIGWWAGGATVKTASENSPRISPAAPAVAGNVTREFESLVGRVTGEKSSSRQFALLAAAPTPHTAGALRAWLDRLDRLPNVEARELAEQLLFRDGADIPFDAMASVLSTTDYRVNASLGRAWAEREGLPGLTRALTHPGAPITSSVIAMMAQVCAQTDPQGTLGLLLQQGLASPTAFTGLSSVFSEWVKHDPDQATAALAALPEAQRQSASWSLAYAWAASDPRKALDWVGSQEEAHRSDLVVQICDVWAMSAPDLAADALVKIAPDQIGNASSLFARWCEHDAEGMMTWINQQTELPGQAHERLLGIAASTLATRDPDRAWGLVTDLSAEQRSNVLGSISRSLFAKDPAAAMAWAGQLIEATDRASYIMSMADIPTGTTPEQREKFFAALPDTEPGAATVKLNLLAKTDAAAARQYWDNLSDDNRASIMRQGLGQWGEAAPDLASAIIHEKLTLQTQARASGSTSDGSDQVLGIEASQVAVLLANRDPQSAKTWISSLPPGPVASDVAANFAANHGRFDRAGVESWLSAEPDDSPVRSGLLRGLARLDNALGDPSSAFNHVRQLDPADPGRSAALRDVFTTWQETEPEQAARAFDTLSLTPQEREKLGLPAAP
jgi:hypothetical protein